MNKSIRKSWNRTHLATITIHLLFLIWQTGRRAFLHTYQIEPFKSKSQFIGQHGKVGMAKLKNLLHRLKLKNLSHRQKLSALYFFMNRYLLSCGNAAKQLNNICRSSRLWKATVGKVFDRKTVEILREQWLLRRTSGDRWSGRWKSAATSSKKFLFVKGCFQQLRNLPGTKRLKLEKFPSGHQARPLKQWQYNTKLALYKKIPFRAISRAWGRMNKLELPVWLRSPAIRLYVWIFNCCLEEAAVQDLKQYRNLSEFFRRLLRPGSRPLASSSRLVSPADGRILHCGKVCNGVLEQVKGVTYSLTGFLGPLDAFVNKPNCFDQTNNKAAIFDPQDGRSLLMHSWNCLHYCVIYLSPGDYHRFHSPTDWKVKLRRHFPGELFSVNPSVARWLKGLFNLNERALYLGEWIHGFFSMTAVGALNVGSITVYMDEGLKTNKRTKWEPGCYFDQILTNKDNPTDDVTSAYDVTTQCDNKEIKILKENERFLESSAIGSGVRIVKGNLFGEFNLGSTIVLLFEAPKDFRFSVKTGNKVRYGQNIASSNYNKSVRHKTRKF